VSNFVLLCLLAAATLAAASHLAAAGRALAAVCCVKGSAHDGCSLGETAAGRAGCKEPSDEAEEEGAVLLVVWGAWCPRARRRCSQW
jgi:hypothetical protein